MSYLRIRAAAVEDAAELLEIYKPYVENTAITFEYEVPSVKEFAARRAGVEDDDFRLFKGRFDEPPALQGSGEPKRVVDVHLAAKRDDMESSLRHREMLHVSR